MSNIEELKNTGLKATLPRLKILEVFQNAKQRHMSDGIPLAWGHPLRFPVSPAARVQKPFADFGDELAIVLPADQREHHIEGGRAARAGAAIAIDLVARAGDGVVREPLAKGRNVFRIDIRKSFQCSYQCRGGGTLRR